MDYGQVPGSLLPGEALPASSGQKDHLNEEYLPDNDYGSLCSYLDACLDLFPYYVCDSVLEKLIRMIDSDWNSKNELPRWWPSGMRYMAVKTLKKEGMLDVSANEYRLREN